MTKEQFIKRVGEITGYKHAICLRTYRDRKEWFSFLLGDKMCRDRYLLLINTNSIELFDTYIQPKVKMALPHKWLLPLGEAIKEYYEKTS